MGRLGRVHRDIKFKQVREQRKEVLAELKDKSQYWRTEVDGGQGQRGVLRF